MAGLVAGMTEWVAEMAGWLKWLGGGKTLVAVLLWLLYGLGAWWHSLCALTT